jgi:hypothetical protein
MVVVPALPGYIGWRNRFLGSLKVENIGTGFFGWNWLFPIS